MNPILRVLLVGLVFASGRSLQAQTDDLDTQLLLSTLKVSNPNSTGTGFVLTRPDPTDPKKVRTVLITADHVFRQMNGEEATLFFHRRDAAGSYIKVPTKLKIRSRGKSLWTKHPTSDVAVIELTPPPDVLIPGLSVDLLATDAELKRFEIHPGDAIKGIGFPHANQFEANSSGFGVVRLGCLASFPLLPTKKTKTFLFDFNTFEGDSGGPVYLSESQRRIAGKVEPGRAELILGLVMGQHFLDEEYKMVYQAGKFRHRMGMGIIVHASAIKEAIDLLPAVSDPPERPEGPAPRRESVPKREAVRSPG